MIRRPKTHKRLNPLKISCSKSISLCGCIAFAVCVAATASASDKSNGLLSRIFPIEECFGKIDWFQVGLSDGKVGIELSYFSVYERQCARRSRVPDKRAYLEGYDEGVQAYCSPENIYQLARTGAVAIGACEDSHTIRKAVRDGFANLKKR